MMFHVKQTQYIHLSNNDKTKDYEQQSFNGESTLYS